MSNDLRRPLIENRTPCPLELQLIRYYSGMLEDGGIEEGIMIHVGCCMVCSPKRRMYTPTTKQLPAPRNPRPLRHAALPSLVDMRCSMIPKDCLIDGLAIRSPYASINSI